MDYFQQESDRLTYRKLTLEDIPSWSEFFVNNDLLHFFGFDLQKSKETLAENWIQLQFGRYEKLGIGHLAVELKEGGDLIGVGGILPRELDGKQEYEIAYSLIPKYWGKGYATEVAKQMKTFASKNIKADRLISIIDLENHDSAKVAKKNAMEVLFRTEYEGMTVDVYGIENLGLAQ